jgi:glycosyltransferase involved in cell wall biosynthesis
VVTGQDSFAIADHAGCTGTVPRAGTPQSVGSRPTCRVAFIASHPIQYVAPLYQSLARRDDLAIKVFYTWHAAEAPVADRGFARSVAWDVPLTQGYDFERVANVSASPGTHRFLGLRNPGLAERVVAWEPDAVVVNGWAWLSHLQALYALHRRGVCTLFRGDSHLLDDATTGPRWLLKQALLRQVFSWPAGFLVVGSANRAYYESFGVEPARLHACPHSIDVSRFAEPADELERQASEWRTRLGITPSQTVVLFAGKFERKKRPLELMRTVQRLDHPGIVLVLVGGGELQNEIDAVAAAEPARFRVIPFQNQSRMPVVYRLGDLFVLPSAHGETWGLATNEALASGRPVLVSDRVGCAAEVIDADCGRVYFWNDLDALGAAITEWAGDRDGLTRMRAAAAQRARAFDIAVTEASLVAAVRKVCGR